jgi:hypothetical protein
MSALTSLIRHLIYYYTKYCIHLHGFPLRFTSNCISPEWQLHKFQGAPTRLRGFVLANVSRQVYPPARRFPGDGPVKIRVQRMLPRRTHAGDLVGNQLSSEGCILTKCFRWRLRVGANVYRLQYWKSGPSGLRKPSRRNSSSWEGKSVLQSPRRARRSVGRQRHSEADVTVRVNFLHGLILCLTIT